MAHWYEAYLSNVVVFGGLWLVWVLRRITSGSKEGTKLSGPPSESFIFGLSRRVTPSIACPDAGTMYQEWAATYGPVYQIPTALWSRRTILCDPKAVNYFYSAERSVYVKAELNRTLIANMFGRGLVWAEGDPHKKQRKMLTPAFSNAAIRRQTDVFYTSAYKLKMHWDANIENSQDGTIIDVQQWMNKVALDSIGIAGFGHDFRTLDGEYSAVAATFESFESDSALDILVLLLGSQLPFLTHLPTKRNRATKTLRRVMSGIADELLEKMRREKETHVADEIVEKSVIGLLLKAEENKTALHMSQEEIVAQMNALLVAGYETTSVSLTWALIELSRNPEKQSRLREELVQFGVTDPTWDQLVALPYLDSVVLETLRLYPPVSETIREAQIDDVIPLTEPITTASGEVVNSIAVSKGSTVAVSIGCMNRSEVFWGPNAKNFQPERWLTLNDDPLRSKEIQGHRHLITFIDGPRTCLGKQFALAEFKAVLTVLIKNYIFELPDGPQTQIGYSRALVFRPKVAGLDAAQVPLRVRRVD